MNRVLLPIKPKKLSKQLLQFSLALLKQLGQVELVLASIIRVPKALPLSYGTLKVASARQWLNKLSQDLAKEANCKTVVKVGHSFAAEIVRVLESYSCNFLILNEDWLTFYERQQLEQETNCHLIYFKNASLTSEAKTVILISNSATYSLTQQLAVCLKDWFNANLEVWLLGEDEKLLLPILEFQPQVKQVQKANVKKEIKQLTSGIVVLDATSRQQLGTLKTSKKVTLLTVKEGKEATTTLDFGFEQFGYWHLPEEKILDKVDCWFAENTFDCEEFSNLDELLALKQQQNVKLSLVLPTLNEEATIGKIIETAKSNFSKLLDEIVVIDSGSKDKTVKIAQAQGVPVYQHQKIAPQFGSYKGKGEALWKSLFVTKGDIIIWVDTDIVNFNPAFIYGLAGPLLKHTELQYIKGFYYRPLKTEAGLQMTGGGRVTELTARPLINLFFPALSGLVQPLSGEYAGRRSLLEQLTFYTGYGVEIGLLLEILNKFGLDVIGQVDLKQRIHRNQSLENLSKMAFAIIQVMLEYLEETHHFRLRKQLNRRLNLIKRGSNRFQLEPEEIKDLKRPPLKGSGLALLPQDF